MKLIFSMTCALLLLASGGRAQNYSIDWHKIAGGGSSGSGGQYTLSGTIGQHDAGGPATNSEFSVSGGFWTIFAVQTAGAPTLGIKVVGGNSVMVYWPSATTGFNLQMNPDLNPVNWTAPSQTINDDGTHKYIIIAPPTGNAYFRLKSQ
jgi:hypothetical protein